MLMAGALMRETPLLLTLDEPTTALDPVAEYALLEHYAAHARRIARLTSAITELLSHRFSTVRMANLVVLQARAYSTALIWDTSLELLLPLSAKPLPHMRNVASRATVRGASKTRKCNG